jgi:hypothetical protein
MCLLQRLRPNTPDGEFTGAVIFIGGYVARLEFSVNPGKLTANSRVGRKSFIASGSRPGVHSCRVPQGVQTAMKTSQVPTGLRHLQDNHLLQVMLVQAHEVAPQSLQASGMFIVFDDQDPCCTTSPNHAEVVCSPPERCYFLPITIQMFVHGFFPVTVNANALHSTAISRSRVAKSNKWGLTPLSGVATKDRKAFPRSVLETILSPVWLTNSP